MIKIPLDRIHLRTGTNNESGDGAPQLLSGWSCRVAVLTNPLDLDTAMNRRVRQRPSRQHRLVTLSLVELLIEKPIADRKEYSSQCKRDLPQVYKTLTIGILMSTKRTKPILENVLPTDTGLLLWIPQMT